VYPVFSLKNKRKQQPDVSPIDSAAVRKIRQEDLGFATIADPASEKQNQKKKKKKTPGQGRSS
jgi:hypothetical protein